MQLAGIAVAASLGAFAVTSPGRASQSHEVRYQSMEAELTSTAPGRPTGFVQRVDYFNPHDPNGKPVAVRKVTTTLARGSKIDTSVPARCTASDEELMEQGAAACPRRSKIAEGFARLDTGLPGPARLLTFDAELFNNTGEQIALGTMRGGGLRVVFRAPIRGRSWTFQTEPLPGAPPDGTAFDAVELEYRRIVREVDGRRRAYFTTPSRCRQRGQWRNHATFAYADGVTQRIGSTSPCHRRRAGAFR